MRAPTLKDVAKFAGVSAATASRALTGSPHVRDETRQRVIEAAKSLAYQPDQVARSLRRRRTDLIGLVVSTIENSFFTELARGAEQAAHERGYNLILCNTDEDPRQEANYVAVLDRLLVAGIIIAPAPGDGSHLMRIAEAGLPVVLVNRTLNFPDFSSVCADDEASAFQCVSQLISEGRRRIAAITGLPGVSTTQQRLQGYRRALLTSGLEDAICPDLEICGDADLEGGYRAACQLMQLDPRPDALFGFNNLITQGAIMALHDLGIEWPEMVDVAGFGAFQSAPHYRSSAMLISQPTHEMGQKAVDILLSQLEVGSTRTVERVVLQNTVLSRQVKHYSQCPSRIELNLAMSDASESELDQIRVSECEDGVCSSQDGGRR